MSSNNNKKNGNKKNGKNLGKTGGIKLNTTRDSGFSDSLTEDLSAATNRVVARTEHSLTINEPSSSSSQDEATNITLSTKCFADKGKLKKVEEDILIISNSESNSENHQQQQQQQQQGLSDLSANSSSMAIRDATNHDYITIVKTTKVTTKVKHIKETKNKKNKTSKQDETTGAVVEASESSGVSSDLTSTRVCTVAKTSQSSQSILAVNTTSQHHIRGGGSVIGLLEEEVENSSSADEEFSVAAPSLLQVKVNKSTEESVYETSATAPQPQQMIVDLNSTVLDCEDILSTYSTQANRQSTASPKMMLEQQQLKSSTIPKKEETKATTQPEAVAKVAGPQPPQKSAKKRTIFSFFSISKKNNEEEKENKKDKKSKKSKKQIEEQPKLVAEKTEAKEMEIVVDTAAVESKLQSPLASPSNSSFSNMLQFGNQKHELLDPEQKERIIYLKPQCVQFIAQKLLESEPKPKSEEFQKNLSKMIARALDLLGHDRVPSLDYLVNKLNEEYQVEDDQNKDKVNSVQTKDYFNDHFQRFLLNERCLLQLDLDKSQVQPAEEIIQFNADGSKQKPFADLQNEKKEIVIQPQDVNLNIHNLAVIRQNLDLNINDMMMASTTKDEVKPVKGGIDEWNVGLDHTYDPNKPHKPIQMDQSNSPKAADTTKVDITKTKKTKKEKHQEQKTEVVDLPFDAHIVLETVKEPPILFPSDENYKHPEGLFKEVEMVVTKEVDEGPILDKKIEEKIIPKQKKEKKKSKNPLTSCLTCSCASGVTKEEKKKRKQETEPILDKESESDADLAFSVPTATVEMPLFTIDFSNLDAPPKSETEERPKLDEKPVEVKEDYEKQQHDEEVEKTNAQHKVSIVDAVNQLIKTTETQVVTTSEEVEKIRQGDEKQSTVVATTPPATPNVKTEFDEEKYVDPLKNQLNIITPMLKGETETDVIKTQASEVRVADTVDAGMATEVIDQNPEPPKLKDVKKEVKKHKLKLASCFLCKSKKKGKKDHETQSEVKEKEEVVVAVETNVQDEAKVIDPKLFQGLDRAVDQPLLCFDVPSVIDLPKITTTREAAGPEEKKKKTEKNKKEDDDLSWEMVRHEDVEDAPPLPLEEEKKEEQEEVKQEVEQPKVEEIKLKTIEVKEEPIIELDLPILDIITVDVKKTTAEEEEESRRGGKPSDDPVVLPDLNDRLLIQLPQLAEGKLSELPDPNKQELAQPVQTKFSLASCFKCQCAGSKGSKVKKNNKKKELALSPTSAHAAAEVKEEEKKEEEQKQETVDTTPVDLTWSVGLDRKEGEFVVRREPEPVQTQVIDLPSIVDVVVEQQQNEEETLSSAPAAAEITEKKEETAPEVVQKAPVESKVLQPEVKELDVEKIKEVDLIGARIVLDREPDHAYIPIVTSTTPNPVVVATEQQLESVPQETEKNVVEDKLKKTEKKKKRKFNLNMPLINCLNPKYRKQKKEKKDLAATPAENLPLVEDEIKQEEPLETKVKEEDFVVDARWSQGLDRSQDQPLINKEPIVEISLTESPPPKEEIKKEEEEIKVEAKKEEEMKQLERQPQEEMKQEIDLDIKQVNLEEGQHIVLDCEPDNVTLPDSTNRETVPQVLYVEERLAVANEQSPVEKKQKRKRSSKTSCIDMPLLKCLVPRNEEHKTKKKDIKKKTTKNAAKDETVETPAVAAEASPEAKEENTVEVRKVFTNLVDMPVVELIVPKLVDKEEDEKKKEEKIKKLEEEILPSAETEVATSVCPAFDDAKNKRIKRKEKKEEEERVEESKTATTAATEATTIVEHIKLDRRPDPVVLPDLNQRQAQVLVKETVKEEEHPLAAEAELTKTDEQKKKKKKKERRTLLIDMPIINILIPKEKKHKLKEMKGKTPAEVTAPFVAEDLAPAETTPVSVVDTSWSVGLDRKENELLVRRVEDDVVKRVEEPKPIEVAASEATLDIPILDIVFVQKLEQNLKKSTHTLPPPTQGKESKKSFWTKCILCKGSKKNKEETASLPDKKTKKQKKQILEMEQVPVSPPTEVEAATIVIKPYDAATEQQPEQKAAIDMFSMMSNLDAPYVEKKEETEKKPKKEKKKKEKIQTEAEVEVVPAPVTPPSVEGKKEEEIQQQKSETIESFETEKPKEETPGPFPPPIIEIIEIEKTVTKLKPTHLITELVETERVTVHTSTSTRISEHESITIQPSPNRIIAIIHTKNREMIDEEQEARADKHHQPQHYRSEVELLDIEIEPEIQQQLEEIRSKPLKKKKDKKDSFKLKLPQKKSSSLFCKCFMCSKAKRESKKKEGKPKELEEVKAESEQVEAVPVKQQKEAVAINVDLFKGLDRAPNQQPLKEIDYRGFIDVEPIKKEKKKKSTTTTKEEGNASPNLITTTPTTLPEVTENTTTLPKQTEPILETPILDQNLEILKEELEKVKTEEEKDKGAHVVLNTRKEPPIVFPGEQQKQQQNTTVRVKEEFKEVNEGAAKKLEEGARIILDTIKETPILFTSDLEPEAKTSVSAVPEKEHFEATVTVEKKPEEEAIGTQPKKKGFSLASCFHCGACASRKKTKKIKSEKNAKEHKPAFIDNTIDLPCIQTPDNPILNKEDEIVSKKKKDKKQKPEPMPPKKPPRGQLIETTNFEQVTPVIATPSTVQVQIEEKEGDRIVLDTRKEPPIVFPGEHQQKTTHIAISSNKEEDEEISRKLAEGAHIVLETKKEPPIVFPGERVGEFKIEIKQEEIKVATESSQVQEKAPVITVVETTKDKKRKKAEEKQKHHEERRKKNVQEEEEKRKRKEQEEEQKRLKKELEDEEKRNREEEKRIKEEQEEEEKRKGKEKEKEDEKSLKKEAQESEAKAKQKTEEGTRVVLNTVKEPPIVFPGEQKETTTTTVAAPISPVSKKQKEKEEGDRTVLNTVKEPPIVFTSETTKTATICPLEAPVSLSKKKEDTEKLAERAHIVLDTKKEPAIVFTSDLEGKKEVEFPSYYIAEIVTHKGDTTAATTEEKKKSSKEKLPKTTTTTTTTATLSSITSTLKKESEDDQMATDINKVKQLNVEDAKLLNKNRKRCVTYLKQKSDYDENKCSNKEEKRSLKLATKLYGKCIKYTLKNNRTKKQKDRLTYDQIKHKLSKKSYTFGRTEHITRCVQQFQIDLETGQLLEQLKEKKDDKKEQRRKKSSVDETSSWSINQIFNRHKQKKSKKLEEQAAATANQAEEEEQPVIRRYPSLTWREANERARILFYKGRVPSIHYNEKRDSFRVSMITQIKSKTDGKERPQEVPVFDEDVRRLLNASGLYWDGESISLLNKSEEIFNQVQRDAFDFLQLINANKESVNITEQDYLKAELTNGSDEQQQQRQSKLSYTY